MPDNYNSSVMFFFLILPPSLNSVLVWLDLVWFYGIPTMVGYLMPNHFHTYILNIVEFYGSQ